MPLPPPAPAVVTQRKRHLAKTALLTSCGVGAVLSRRVQHEGALLPAPSGDDVLLVVLGAPPTSTGKLTTTLQQRLLQAAVYAGRHPTWTVLITGIGDGPRAETPLMQRVLRDEGVDDHRMIVDDHAMRTYDSVVRLQALLPAHEAVVFVSQRDHAMRATYMARALGAPFATGVVCAGPHGVKHQLREHVARVRAYVDVQGGMQPTYDVERHPLRRLSTATAT